MTIRAWTVEPLWKGEDVFIICGGTSLNPETVQRLRGRPGSHSIAVNRSYIIAPWADVLFFADDRWWVEEHVQNRGPLLQAFPGQVVTTAEQTRDAKLWHLKKIEPSDAKPLSGVETSVALLTTSVTGALNISLHKGARRVILIGCDNKHGPEGRIHYHQEYPWDRTEESWWAKERELRRAARGMAAAGIEVINASPGSALDFWPIVELGTWLDMEDANGRQG